MIVFESKIKKIKTNNSYGAKEHIMENYFNLSELQLSQQITGKSVAQLFKEKLDEVTDTVKNTIYKSFLPAYIQAEEISIQMVDFMNEQIKSPEIKNLELRDINIKVGLPESPIEHLAKGLLIDFNQLHNHAALEFNINRNAHAFTNMDNPFEFGSEVKINMSSLMMKNDTGGDVFDPVRQGKASRKIAFEGILAHEMGHALKYGLIGSFNNPKIQAAIDKDEIENDFNEYSVPPSKTHHFSPSKNPAYSILMDVMFGAMEKPNLKQSIAPNLTQHYVVHMFEKYADSYSVFYLQKKYGNEVALSYLEGLISEREAKHGQQKEEYATYNNLMFGYEPHYTVYHLKTIKQDVLNGKMEDFNIVSFNQYAYDSLLPSFLIDISEQIFGKKFKDISQKNENNITIKHEDWKKFSNEHVDMFAEFVNVKHGNKSYEKRLDDVKIDLTQIDPIIEKRKILSATRLELMSRLCLTIADNQDRNVHLEKNISRVYGYSQEQLKNMRINNFVADQSLPEKQQKTQNEFAKQYKAFCQKNFFLSDEQNKTINLLYNIFGEKQDNKGLKSFCIKSFYNNLPEVSAIVHGFLSSQIENQVQL